MIPDTFLGLVLFVVVASPGYVYIRVAEARALRPVRSQLLHLAELVVVGVGTTLGAALLISLIWRLACGESLIDLKQWIRVGWPYFETNVYSILTALGVILVGSNVLAFLGALAIHRGKPPGYQPGNTVWTDVLARDSAKTRVFISMRLKDGRRLEGCLFSFQTDDTGEGIEIALQPPIFVALPGAGRTRQRNTDRVVISTKDVMDFAVRYDPVSEGESP